MDLLRQHRANIAMLAQDVPLHEPHQDLPWPARERFFVMRSRRSPSLASSMSRSSADRTDLPLD
jgi:hypothetical protein